MKTYELIKSYPGREKGLRVDEDGNFIEYKYVGKLSPRELEFLDQEQYWKKHIRNFEVISIVMNGHLLTYNSDRELWESKPKGDSTRKDEKYIYSHQSLDFILSNPGVYTLHSVKRVIDGEIFSIGDYVKHQLGSNDLIMSINIEDNCAYFSGIENQHKRAYSISLVNHINRPMDINLGKERIFTSEDGVDIYEDSKLYLVYNNLENKDENKVMDNPFEVMKYKGNIENRSESKYYHWFSSREAAEGYILKNKPCLSLKDISDIIHLNEEGDWFIQLKELAKERQ